MRERAYPLLLGERVFIWRIVDIGYRIVACVSVVPPGIDGPVLPRHGINAESFVSMTWRELGQQFVQ